KLVDLFGSISDLRIPLAAVNDFDAKPMSQVVELVVGSVVCDCFGLGTAEFLIRQRSLSDVQKSLLRKMTDQAWVRAVLKYSSRPRLLPSRDHAPQIHVAPVERAFRRVFVGGAGVRVPDFN